MLIVTRKRGESVVINGNIVVTVVEFFGNTKIRLGIDAPKSVKILREELVGSEEDKRRDNQIGA